MGKMNLGNIQNALGKVRDAAAPLQGKGHTENVPVDFIHPSERNIFNEDDTLESIQALADDIETNGLIHPIAVNKISRENYQILSGERRYRAMTEILHRRTIPCMVFDGLSEDEAQLRLYMANLAVREYSTAQKFRFYLEVKALLEKMKTSGEYKGGMQKGIAQLLNVSERQVRKYAQIEKLPEDLQQDVIEGRISFNKALEIASEKEKQETDAKATEDDSNAALLNMLATLTDEQKALLLSGQVSLSDMFVPSKKEDTADVAESYQKMEEPEAVPIFDEPVLSDSAAEDTSSKNEDTADTATEPFQEMEKPEPVPIFDEPVFADSVAEDTSSKNEDTADTVTEPFQEMEKPEPVPIFDEAVLSDSAAEDTSSKNEDTADVATEPFQEMEKAEPVPVFDEPVLSDRAAEGTSSKNEDTTDVVTEPFQEMEKAEPVPIFDELASSDSNAEVTPSKKEDTVQKQPSDCGFIIFEGKQYPIDKVYLAKDRDDCIIFKAYVNKK